MEQVLIILAVVCTINVAINVICHRYFSLCNIILHSLGERQVVNLVKIAAFCRDINLLEAQQAEMKRQCLSYWEVPDRVRTAPPRVAPETKCDDILKKTKAGPSGGRALSPLNITGQSLETLTCKECYGISLF
jgi:hypothetical protein